MEDDVRAIVDRQHNTRERSSIIFMMHRSHLRILTMTIVCLRLSGFVLPRMIARPHHSHLFSSNTDIKDLVVGGLLSSVIGRAQSTLEQTESLDRSSNDKRQPEGRYQGNPAIVNTALAHSLWASILRPGMDSAIDATCGNGRDTCAIASILFDKEARDESSKSMLLAVDIQAQACGNTTDVLKNQLGDDIFDKNVRVLQASHSPLPRPSGNGDVGLVVYNLGWLPNSDKDCITKVDSTLDSIADAMLLIRIGGMISVITYPSTNPEEDTGVRLFLECAALLSSNVQTWRAFLDADDNIEIASLSQETKQKIVSVMDRIVEVGDIKQTWRVSEHRKLGMNGAPILLTATRIK